MVAELQFLVCSAVVVVGRVLDQHCSQVMSVDDEQSLGGFASDGAGEWVYCTSG